MVFGIGRITRTRFNFTQSKLELADLPCIRYVVFVSSVMMSSDWLWSTWWPGFLIVDLILTPITRYLRFTFGGRCVLTLICLLSFFNIFLLSVSVSPAREHYDCVRVLFPCTTAVSWLSC